MGQMIDFPSNGGTAQGYLAVPPSGSGPGVVIIQEWWGINDQIREVVRLVGGRRLRHPRARPVPRCRHAPSPTRPASS